MQWSMPHRVLQIVASLIALVALSAFTLGVINAPSRGRLPGERAASGGGGDTTAIQAVEATPLSQERIEGPPPPVPLTEEQKAKQEADKLAKAQAEAAAKLAASSPAAAAVAAPPPAAPDRVGEILQNAPPAPEEPPH